MKKLLFNRAIRIFLATNSLVLIAGAMLGPIYALFVEKIGGDLLDASLTSGAFALAAGLATLIAGRYADKVKENELIVVVGYAIIGIGFLLYTAVNSIWSLLAVQCLIGFAEAIYSPAFDAIYSKHLDHKRAGRAWGAWEALDFFTRAIGAIIGGLIATFFGFVALFIIMALLCFASATYIYYLPREVL